MVKEQRRRPAVFQSAEEPSEENLDEILSGGAEVRESLPVEAVLPEGVLPHGWKVITQEQQTGKQYLVSADGTGEGIRAFWRKTRVLSHFRWVINGKWSNALTHADVLPQPRYYKEVL